MNDKENSLDIGDVVPQKVINMRSDLYRLSDIYQLYGSEKVASMLGNMAAKLGDLTVDDLAIDIMLDEDDEDDERSGLDSTLEKWCCQKPSATLRESLTYT